MNVSICIMYNKDNTTRRVVCRVYALTCSVTDRVSAANEEIEKNLLNFKQEKKLFTKRWESQWRESNSDKGGWEGIVFHKEKHNWTAVLLYTTCSLSFFVVRRARTRERRKWPSTWLKARNRRGTQCLLFLASLFSRAHVDDCWRLHN